MDSARASLLAELESTGRRHDATELRHENRLLNITAETGRFLAVLVRATRSCSILEIGTSNGYSTIWLADAASSYAGRVITIESAPHKAALAKDNIARAKLSGIVQLVEGDALHVIGEMAATSVDLIFLDADRHQYGAMWTDISRILKRGGLLVVDNACSHAGEIEPLARLIGDDPAYETSLVPVGKGELLAVKSHSL